MTQRFHFLSLLCALSLIAIFGLNYFDRIYIRFVMLLLFVAVVTDLLWLIFKAHVLLSLHVDSVVAERLLAVAADCVASGVAVSDCRGDGA
jgi:hypothetical protein